MNLIHKLGAKILTFNILGVMTMNQLKKYKMRTTDLFEYQVEDVNFESLGFWEFQSKPKPMQLIERICMNLEEENKYKFYVVYSENIDDGETLIVEELTEKEFDKMNNGDEFLTVENDSLDDEYGG